MHRLANYFLQSKTLFKLLIIAVAVAGYYFYAYNSTRLDLDKLKKNPQVMSQQETSALVAKVGKLVALPNEQPTIATVNDISKLKDQPFFAQAENGDKILIYANAKKAYLYSVKQNKVLDVAPVNIGPFQGVSSTPKP
jgi:hypothetical protein